MKPLNKKIFLMVVLLLLPMLQSLEASEIVLQAAGDVMLGGRWEEQVARNKYLYPFERIAPELRKGDITLINLEAPLTSGGKEFSNKKYRFRVNPLAAEAFKKSGITVVNLANNHIMDYGAEGLLDTLCQLDKTGISHVGAGENLSAARKPVIFDIKATKVAILGYSLTLPNEFWAGSKKAGTVPLLEKLVKEDIVLARKQAKIVVVTVHWGEEGKTTLRPYQSRLGRMMIDAGADAVIGHHPHILQGIERYKRGLIFYSLGNFIFASKSRIADKTVLVRLRFDGELRTAELIPINIRHKEVGFQPALISGKQADTLIDRIRRLPPGCSAIRKDGGRYLVAF